MNTDVPGRAALYCRISDDREGRELGVERQERLCRDLATKIGATVIRVYVDNDLSASESAKKVRPDFTQLMADAQAGRFDTIISYTLKRLTRQYNEGGALLELARDHGVRYVFVRASPIDLNTAAGRKQFRTMVNDAISETDEMSERISDANKDLRDLGEPTTHLGFGFIRTGTRQWEVDQVGKPVINQGAQDLLAGLSLRSIVRSWDASDFQHPSGHWNPDAVRSTLSKPAIAGLLAHKGKVVRKGNWKPVLDEKTWRAVRVVLADPSRVKNQGNRNLKWIGSGSYLCGVCDDDKTTMRSNANTKQGNHIYRCRAKNHLGIRAEPVDSYVRDQIADILRAKGPRLLVVDRTEDIEGLRVSLEDLQAQQADLGRDYAKKVISKVAFLAADADFTQQLAEVESRLAQAVAPAGHALEGIADAPDPGKAFLDAGFERQRAIVRAIATVTILPDAGRARTPGEVDLDRIDIVPK